MKVFNFQMIGGGDFMTNIICHFLSAYYQSTVHSPDRRHYTRNSGGK